MHSFGASNGTSGVIEETVAATSANLPRSTRPNFASAPEPHENNGIGGFSNGDVSTTGATGGSSNGVVNSGGSSTNGSVVAAGRGGEEEDDDDEHDGVFDGDLGGPGYMNGSGGGGRPRRPPKKQPPPYVIKSQTDRDIIRLIGQQLRIMGLESTVGKLIEESGCRLDHPTAATFRDLVMKGEWSKADQVLHELKHFLDSPKHLIIMKYLILEQKYLECIEEERNGDALKCLQTEITPLNYKKEKLPKICRYLFLNSLDELKKVANWEGKGQTSRQKLMEKLQNFLPPSIMLPPRRLQSLLNQAIELQKEHCFFHNYNLESSWEDCSLLVDHSCSKDDLPSETKQVLTEHRDEVWYCHFSNDGTRLASGSKDGTIIIWDVDPDTYQVTLRHTFGGHTFAIAFFAWSPDDHYLVALGPEESGEFWIWDVQTGLIKHKGINQNEDSLTTCAWHKDSQRFVAAGTKGHFYQIDLNGVIVDNWEGVRVQCLAYKNDGKTVLAADTHFRIRGYNFEEVNDFTIIKEDHSIVSFVCDQTGRYALVNVESQGVHLWDLDDRVLVRKFQGISQGYYTIHSCFGGVDQVFLASGSEDNKIYIWHMKREHPISVLKGHKRTVNCVSWNPRYPNMLASASDDTTVRIWCSKRRPSRQQSTSSSSSSGSSSSGSSTSNSSTSSAVLQNNNANGNGSSGNNSTNNSLPNVGGGSGGVQQPSSQLMMMLPSASSSSFSSASTGAIQVVQSGEQPHLRVLATSNSASSPSLSSHVSTINPILAPPVVSTTSSSSSSASSSTSSSSSSSSIASTSQTQQQDQSQQPQAASTSSIIRLVSSDPSAKKF